MNTNSAVYGFIFIILMFAITCFFIGASVGMQYKKYRIEKDAEKNGVGEFFINEKHAIEFRWKK